MAKNNAEMRACKLVRAQAEQVCKTAVANMQCTHLLNVSAERKYTSESHCSITSNTMDTPNVLPGQRGPRCKKRPLHSKFASGYKPAGPATILAQKTKNPKSRGCIQSLSAGTNPQPLQQSAPQLYEMESPRCWHDKHHKMLLRKSNQISARCKQRGIAPNHTRNTIPNQKVK